MGKLGLAKKDYTQEDHGCIKIREHLATLRQFVLADGSTLHVVSTNVTFIRFGGKVKRLGFTLSDARNVFATVKVQSADGKSTTLSLKLIIYTYGKVEIQEVKLGSKKKER